MALPEIPEDFPRESGVGSVPGAQPKLLLRRSDGIYHDGLTLDELRERYDVCEDLAGQLSRYAAAKMSTLSLSVGEVVELVERAVSEKVRAGLWEFSQEEVAWVMARTRTILSGGVS